MYTYLVSVVCVVYLIDAWKHHVCSLLISCGVQTMPICDNGCTQRRCVQRKANIGWQPCEQLWPHKICLVLIESKACLDKGLDYLCSVWLRAGPAMSPLLSERSYPALWSGVAVHVWGHCQRSTNPYQGCSCV